MRISDLIIGNIYSNSDLVNTFVCGNMGGMRKSNTTRTLMIVSDHTKGLYDDMWHDILQKAAVLRGRKSAPQKQVITTQRERDPFVSEHVKRRAKEICDLCSQLAPFKDKKGRAYLESHHVIWLADGGEDSIENAVALCPNCHRKMHIQNHVDDVNSLKVVLGYYKRKGQ